MGDNGEMQWRSGHSPIMNGINGCIVTFRGRHNDFDFLYDMRGLQALSLANRLSWKPLLCVNMNSTTPQNSLSNLISLAIKQLYHGWFLARLLMLCAVSRGALSWTSPPSTSGLSHRLPYYYGRVVTEEALSAEFSTKA